MGAVPPLLLIGTCIVCLGNLLHIIGLGSPHWFEREYTTSVRGFAINIKSNMGLFRMCDDITDKCDDIEDPPTKLQAVQAMCVMGMLAGLAAGAAVLLFVILKLLSKSPPKLMTLACTAASMAAFVLIIIGVIVFGSEVFDSDLGDLGFSFGLSIVGAILLAAGGFVVLLGSKSVE